MQRLALYATLGLLLAAVNQTWDSWAFWCVMAIFWAAEHLAFQAGIKVGVVHGMDIYRNLKPEQREEIDKNLKDIK